MELIETVYALRRSVVYFTPGQKTVEMVWRVDETSRPSNPPCGSCLAKGNNVVDAREALGGSISEVIRDHKDCAEAKRMSQKWFIDAC